MTDENPTPAILPAPTSDPGRLSRRVKVGASAVAALLVAWFFFAWLILDQHILDAAGESVGTAFALGVVVSLVGAIRSSR
ncbi:MAG TPA: hypothetical protein VK028_16280 [Micromonosporaceae bacterium]|nr:hypothetical protein [Micromonosporaceae bacterium]